MTSKVENEGHPFDVKYIKNGKSYDLGPICFALDDLERLRVKVTIL